jgi:hypothetical protein
VRIALVALNLLVATTFAGLFAWTFFARAHVTRLAEDYVIAKTVDHVTPAVAKIDEVLRHPAARLAPAAVRAAVQAEVDAFRTDPHGYVRKLVARGAVIEKPKHAFAERVFAWKEQARAYFDKTLTSLIRDLRIFFGTNCVAALLAAGLAWRATGRWRWHVLGMSVLLLGVLALHAYLFIDDLTFFRVVTNARVGWSYPLVLALTFGYLYFRIGRFVPLAPNPPGSQKPVAVRERPS